VSLPCPRQRVASHDEVGRVAPRPLNKQATSFDPVRPKPVTEILVRHLLRFGDLEGFRLRQASVPIFTRSGKASSVTSRRSRSDTPYLATLNFIDPHPPCQSFTEGNGRNRGFRQSLVRVSSTLLPLLTSVQILLCLLLYESPIPFVSNDAPSS